RRGRTTRSLPTTEASAWDRPPLPPWAPRRLRMHELSIAISLIEAAQDEAEKHKARAVVAVHLRLGAMSGVVKEALLFSYGVAAQGTPLEGSTLIIEEVPV